MKLQNKITKLLAVLDIHNIVQEAVTKTIPKEKKCKKAKWLFEKALQIAMERREKKKAREEGKDIPNWMHSSREYQGVIKKKAFLNEQCKEREGSNKMGKTRDIFKKIGDIKGKFHARMGMIKDKNGKDLTNAYAIKKR